MRVHLVLAAALSASMIAWAQGSNPAGNDTAGLAQFVRNVQLRNVKASTGTNAYECVTNDDLERFVQAGRADAIARSALNDPLLPTIVGALRALSRSEQAAALSRARATARPTWQELGRMPKDGSGQSDAGHKEEAMIAERIVDGVQEMLDRKAPPAAVPTTASACDPGLAAFIRGFQVKNVKAFTGVEAYQCFTEEDLNRFKAGRRAEIIADQALADSRAPGIVQALRSLSAGERERTLDGARATARPTLGELGRAPTDGSAQTDAGQQAERMIAEQIVERIQKLLAR